MIEVKVLLLGLVSSSHLVHAEAPIFYIFINFKYRSLLFENEARE